METHRVYYSKPTLHVSAARGNRHQGICIEK